MADWHEEYRALYAKLKKAGQPFFPKTVFKDVLVAGLLLGALSWITLHYGVALEELADPTDTTYNPRPEWYFLFMFQALKFFPGHLEAVAAVLLPGLGVLALLALPLIDGGPKRHPLDRPFWTGLGVFSLLGFGWLTWAGYNSPMTNPVMEKDQRALSGLRLYRSLNCAYCHSIGSEGGHVGPDLKTAAEHRGEEWLARHLRDPQSVNPGSAMPKLNLLDEEIKDLVAYMRSLSAGPFTPEAPKLFVEHCGACHIIGKEGGDSGPDLSLIGSAREKSFLKRYIEDPSSLNTASSMPGFKGQLTETQIEDLSRYLSSLGR